MWQDTFIDKEDINKENLCTKLRDFNSKLVATTSRMENFIHENEFIPTISFRYTCRGLFERHKLLFSFQMCGKILEAAGKLNMDEYNFFLRGGVVCVILNFLFKLLHLVKKEYTFVGSYLFRKGALLTDYEGDILWLWTGLVCYLLL